MKRLLGILIMAILAGIFFAAEASAISSGLPPAPVGTGSLGAPPIATIDYLISRGYMTQADKDLILTLSEGGGRTILSWLILG